MEVVQWLIVNALLPLLPILFFYLCLWLLARKITWIPPIRDGQICFYSTTLAIIAIKDILAKNPEPMPLFGLVACWLLSFFVYSFSVYSTIYPDPDAGVRRAVDARVALASLFCGIVTTVMVVGLRLHYGVLT
jgi:hypothetical protein